MGTTTSCFICDKSHYFPQACTIECNSKWNKICNDKNNISLYFSRYYLKKLISNNLINLIISYISLT